jgi:hypothetical protein
MTTFWLRINAALLTMMLVVGVAIVALLATRAFGGPLDPTGPPTSTMKSLDEIPSSWSRRLNAANGNPGGGSIPAGCDSERFRCVLTYTDCFLQLCTTNYPAVLDEETGLVWERVPGTSQQTWANATSACSLRTTGQRSGWRLPTSAELDSLRDTTVTADPQLPVGNPFTITTKSIYWWTSTENLDVPGSAYWDPLYPSGYPDLFAKTTYTFVWCVRGPTSNR